MPQFDPSSFASQIFWLAICFGLLYFAMSKVFLPRIRDILHNRDTVINNDKAVALQLQAQINEIDETSKLLRDTSAKEYNTAIEQAMKQAMLSKEEAINTAKTKISKMVEESHREMKNIKNDSINDCQKAIDILVAKINHKFLSSN